MYTGSVIIGGSVMACMLFLYGCAFVCWKKHNLHAALFCIVLGGLVPRIHSNLDPMLHEWDECYHALVAKNMITNPIEPRLYQEHVLTYDYKNWQRNEIWLHKQPLSLWCIAASIYVFGPHEFAVRFPSLLWSTLGILVVFLLGKRLFDEHVGLLGAFFFSTNGLIIEMAAGRVSTDHVDSLFLFLVSLSALSIVYHHFYRAYGYLFLAGLCCGLAILTKWLPALIIFPLYLALNIKNRSFFHILKDGMLLGAVAFFVAFPWQWYAGTYFPLEYSWEQNYNTRHVTEALEGHHHRWWYFLDIIRIIINETIYVVLGWLIVIVIKTKGESKYLFLLVWICIPLFVFSYAQTKMQGYLLFSFPAYFLAMASFVTYVNTHLQKAFKKYVVWGIGLVMIVLSLRFAIERGDFFDNQSQALKARQELQELSLSEKSLVFNSPCPIEMMFYSDCTAYHTMPSKEKIDSLIKQNYTIYIVEDENTITIPNTTPLDLPENHQYFK